MTSIQMEPEEDSVTSEATALIRREAVAVKSFFSGFAAFINKGNVVALAVAFIMGGAFQAIVTSLVNDVLMPPIGLAFGNKWGAGGGGGGWGRCGALTAVPSAWRTCFS